MSVKETQLTKFVLKLEQYYENLPFYCIIRSNLLTNYIDTYIDQKLNILFL